MEPVKKNPRRQFHSSPQRRTVELQETSHSPRANPQIVIGIPHALLGLLPPYPMVAIIDGRETWQDPKSPFPLRPMDWDALDDVEQTGGTTYPETPRPGQ